MFAEAAGVPADVEVLADTEVPPRHFEQGVYPLAFALARVIACLL